MKFAKALAIFIVACLTVTALVACDSGASNISQNSGTPQNQACNHSWKAADCKTPKTCTICHQTEGSTIDHTYSNGKCTMCNAEDPLAQFEAGQKVYTMLNEINGVTDYKASSVYSAWQFAIYEAGDDKYVLNSEQVVKDFANAVDLKQDVVVSAIDSLLKKLGSEPSDILRHAVLMDKDMAVHVVLDVFRANEVDRVAEENFDEIKALLKTMTSTQQEQTNYSVLKEYYAETLAYYNFVASPSGSFAQLASTLNGYTSKIEKLKNDLSLTYED